MGRVWVAAGALAGLGAVAMAAYAAHGLAAAAPPTAAMVRDAVQMQGWHALGLLFCGLWAGRAGVLAHVAGAAFLIGLIAFCGAVYALALFGLRLPGVAPFGGTVLMLGWLLLLLSALRPRPAL
jgi:uncharacterized membrane protein YgdD (TMEM256/DUF423 family)